MQDQEIEADVTRNSAVSGLVGRDVDDRVARKLLPIGDHGAAGDEQILPAALGWLRQRARLAGAQAIEPAGKSIRLGREHGLDGQLATGCPLPIRGRIEAAFDAGALV